MRDRIDVERIEEPEAEISPEEESEESDDDEEDEGGDSDGEGDKRMEAPPNTGDENHAEGDSTEAPALPTQEAGQEDENGMEEE